MKLTPVNAWILFMCGTFCIAEPHERGWLAMFQFGVFMMLIGMTAKTREP